MSKSKVTIKPSSLPMGSPVGIIILFGLLLDRLSAPGWIWGAAGVLAVALAIAFILQRMRGVERDVPGFGDDRIVEMEDVVELEDAQMRSALIKLGWTPPPDPEFPPPPR